MSEMIEGFGQEAFKLAFRKHAAGVAIITGRNADGSATGLTASSLASLSAEPPRATFNIAQTSSSWSAVNHTGNYLAIHFLAEHSVDLAKRFAFRPAERFEGDHWHEGPQQLPILHGASAVLITQVSALMLQGPNAVVVVDILSGEISPDEAPPLLYHQRNFHSLGDLEDVD